MPGTILLPIGGGNKNKFITNPARYDAVTGSLLFSSTQTESILWEEKIMPQDYNGDALTFQEIYSMASDVTNKVDPEYEIMALSSGEADPEVASFDAVNEKVGGDTVPDSTTKEKLVEIPAPNTDSLAARDHIFIRRNRDHDDLDDSAVGDQKVRGSSLEYPNT